MHALPDRRTRPGRPQSRSAVVRGAQTPEHESLADWMSPLKIFEYMAAGLPIVTSDLPVLREILAPGRDACMTPPGDAQALVGNPPGGSRIITVRYGQLQSLTNGGLTTISPPGITVFQYNAKLPTSLQFSGGAPPRQARRMCTMK